MIKEQQTVDNIVRSHQSTLYTLVAHRLTKYYWGFRAVSNVSFHVGGSECFGLLGTNGAGKTTIFAMLTGDTPITSGDAFIKNLDIKTSFRKYRRQIGYCPQFDALQGSLTGREIMQLFCALRGVPRSDSKKLIEALIKLVDIAPHIDKTTESYSGGSKRKLSLAIALIGNPVVLLLDEPTAGVDPTARRRIYNTLSYAQEEFKTAVVISSHSMEVCEALCARVAIMVKGTFRCLGPVQHLKSKYGTGYSVQIKLKQVSAETEADLCQAMKNLFNQCSLRQSHTVGFWSRNFEMDPFEFIQ